MGIWVKRSITWTFVLVLVFSLVGCSSSSQTSKAPDPVKITIAQTATIQSSWQKGCQQMADVINKDLGGKFKAEVFGNGILSQGSWKIELEQVQAGSSTLAVESSISLATVVPELFGLNLPFLFQDSEHLNRFLQANPPVLQKWVKKLEGQNLVVLGLTPRPFRQLINSKVLVKTPEDIKGLKLRVPNNPMFIKTFEAMGAKPIPLSPGEMYSAIQLGTVFGEDNSVPVVYDFKTYEVAKNMTLWNYIGDVTLIFMNRDTWNKLNDNEKAVFKKAAQGFMDENAKSDIELTKIAREKMTAAGVKFYEMTNPEKQEFAKLMDPVYAEFAKTAGEADWKEFKAEVDKYKK